MQAESGMLYGATPFSSSSLRLTETQFCVDPPALVWHNMTAQAMRPSCVLQAQGVYFDRLLVPVQKGSLT